MTRVVRFSSSINRSHLAPRAALVALLGALVLSLWLPLRSGQAPPARASDVGLEAALAAALEAHQGLIVPEGGAHYLQDPLARPWSQGLDHVPALVTARHPGEGEVEDLYYMEVRTTVDGSPLAFRRVSNLTRTPYAREVILKRHQEVALLSVEVFGQLQSLLLVDARRDERSMEAFTNDGDRWRQHLTHLQKTGRWDGVGMRLYGLEPPPAAIDVETDGEAFSLTLRGVEGQPDAKARLSMSTGELVDAVETHDATRLSYQPRFLASKSLVPWLVDTIRDLSWVGPRKIALLERFVFRWKDNIKRGAFALGLVSGEGNLAEELSGEAGPAGAALAAMPADRQGDWPPPPVPSRMSKPAPGEGQWAPVQPGWLRTLPGAPPAFLKTAVRMDPQRPYDNIVLIAMDMRQLDLNLVAGTITPESSFGTRGDGLMPRDPEVIDRLVGAFNGGFKTAHGAYGMMVERKTIMPAMPYAATIAVSDQGQVRMGSWYNSMTPPEDLKSLRQNLPPLVADGVFNPTGKRKWGGTASDLDGIHTTRSGVAIRGDDTLIFAWCSSCSADSIGAAMLAAGCQYGMHLDMNPTHTGFSFYRAETRDIAPDGTLKAHKVARGSKAMAFKESRYLNRDVKDFFYLTLRQSLAARLKAPPEGFSEWRGEHSPTGPEGFLALAAAAPGPEPGAALVSVDMSRVDGRMRRGDQEPDPTSSLGKDSAAPQITLRSPALLLDLGVVDLKRPSGFFTDGRIVGPIVEGQPALIIDNEGELRVLEPAEAAKQTPRSVRHLRAGQALILAGQATALPQDAGVGPHHGIGVSADGRLLYAVMSRLEALQGALLQQGAQTAMLMARSPRQAESRLRFLKVDGEVLQEVDPLTGASVAFDRTRDETTHLYLERLPEGPRVALMKLKEVELTREEARRQRKLQTQIQAVRQELRAIENAKYRAFQERKKAREAEK